MCILYNLNKKQPVSTDVEEEEEKLLHYKIHVIYFW